MLFSYYAVFQYDSDGICISFPDIPYCLSCADSDDEAVKMAAEALELALDSMPLGQIPCPCTKDAIALLDNQKAKKIEVELEIINGRLHSSKVERLVTKN